MADTMNESKGFEGRPQRTVDMSFTPARPAPLSAAEAAGATDAQAIDLPTEAPSVELLRYYKRRIEEFEAERELFLTRFQEVQVSVCTYACPRAHGAQEDTRTADRSRCRASVPGVVPGVA